MKRRLSTYLLAATALIATASCAGDSGNTGNGSGFGEIVIAGNGSTQVSVKNTMQEGTVAIDTDIPATDSFSLAITDSEGMSQEWGSVGEYSSEKHYFAAGDYSIRISSGNMDEEGYDKPCFEGETSVKVEARKSVTATVTAYIANTVVAVECTDNFNGYFPSSEFTVSTKAGNSFTTTAPMERPLFIQPQEFSIECNAVKQTGENIALPKQIFTSVNPRTRYTVRFDVAQAGGASVTVELNDTVVEEIDLDAELNDDAIDNTTTE